MYAIEKYQRSRGAGNSIEGDLHVTRELEDRIPPLAGVTEEPVRPD